MVRNGEYEDTWAVKGFQLLATFEPGDGDGVGATEPFSHITLVVVAPIVGAVIVIAAYWAFLCARNGCCSWCCASNNPNTIPGADVSSCCPFVHTNPMGAQARGGCCCMCGKTLLCDVRFPKDPNRRSCHSAWPRNNKKLARRYLLGSFIGILTLASVLRRARLNQANNIDGALGSVAWISEELRGVAASARAINTTANNMIENVTCALSNANASALCPDARTTLNTTLTQQLRAISNDTAGVLSDLGDSPALFADVAVRPSYYFVSFALDLEEGAASSSWDTFAKVYTRYLTYAMVVASFMYGCGGAVGAVLPEKDFKWRFPLLRFSTNVLALNNGMAVVYLLVIALLLSTEILAGVALAGFCHNGVAPQSALVALSRSPMYAASAEVASFVVSCGGGETGMGMEVDGEHNPFQGSLNTTQVQIAAVNHTLEAARSYLEECPGGVLGTCMEILETQRDALVAEYASIFEATRCAHLNDRALRMLDEQLCTDTIGAAYVTVLVHGALAVAVAMVMFTSSFQRQAIYEAPTTVKPHLVKGFDNVRNADEGRMVEQATMVYFL